MLVIQFIEMHEGFFTMCNIILEIESLYFYYLYMMYYSFFKIRQIFHLNYLITFIKFLI
jgi:hypothetical protein